MAITLRADSTTISTAYTIERAKTPTQIVNKGLDGTTYVQILGQPTTTYKLRAVVDTEAARVAADDAWAAGTEVYTDTGSPSVTTDIGVITNIVWQGPLPGGKYLADITTAL